MIELGFRALVLDVSFFVFWLVSGEVGAVLLVRVDDCLTACDGSHETMALVESVRRRFPFGQWEVVIDHPEGVVYTGRRLR
eukprot:3428432-Lingulodinium_polyedra.AAC.1